MKLFPDARSRLPGGHLRLPAVLARSRAEPAALVHRSAVTDDAALLHRVRRQLVAFSAAAMLVALVVLGGALYAVVDQQLGSRAEAQLQGRADRTEALLTRGGHVLGGFDIGGESSGTLAIIIPPGGQAVGIPSEGFNIEGIVSSLPEQGGVEAAAARPGRDDIREVVIDGTPLRVLTRDVQLTSGTYTIQVVQDRSTEQQTLDTLLLVLGLGAVGAVGVATIAGFRFAGQALVPIREALRRQREFAADASHELRTPLAVMRGGLEYLRGHPQRTIGSETETLADLEAEVGHVTGLVEDLLLLARADSGALQFSKVPTDLADVAAEALGPLTVLARERGARLSLDPRPSPTLGDPTRLRQVVTILVDNALRHGRPDGGTVTVTVRREDRSAVLLVDDDGPGIPPAALPHVFDRFWRGGGDAGGGSGLGLAIAASIVSGHGGTIAAEDRPQGGARFVVRLPAAPD